MKDDFDNCCINHSFWCNTVFEANKKGKLFIAINYTFTRFTIQGPTTIATFSLEKFKVYVSRSSVVVHLLTGRIKPIKKSSTRHQTLSHTLPAISYRISQSFFMMVHHIFSTQFLVSFYWLRMGSRPFVRPDAWETIFYQPLPGWRL